MSSDSEDAPYRYRAGATPFFVALVKAQVVVPCVGCCSSGSRHCPQPVPSHYHQSCVGQAARGTRLLVQNRNYGLLASTGTDDQRSALPRDLGVCSRITGNPSVEKLRRWEPSQLRSVSARLLAR